METTVRGIVVPIGLEIFPKEKLGLTANLSTFRDGLTRKEHE